MKLTTPNLLITIVFIAIFTMAVRVPADTDTWWHLRSGQHIVENLTILTTDPFSHTQAGQPWIDHGWLAQVFWYGLYALGGWALLSLVLAGLVTLAFWFIWRQIDQANVFVAAVGMILGAIVSSVVWAARPQMLSFLLAAVVSYLLHRYKRENRSLLPWLPLIVLLWANLHGGFAIAFMLMIAYLMGEAVNNLTRHTGDPVVSWMRLRHLLVAIAISLAVVVINPYTWQMWFYPFQTVGIGALRDYIQEWRSPDFHLLFVQPFAVMLLLTLGAVARAGRKADWTDLALVAMWAWWGLFAARNIAIFGLVVTPVLVRYADIAWLKQWQSWGYSQYPPFSQQALSGRRKTRYGLNWLLLALVLIAALGKIVVPLTPEANQKAERAALPAAAVDYLRVEAPAGPLFNSYNWGGYLIYKLWPEYPVYIDGRTDLYNDVFIRRYLSVMAADDNWEQVLDEDGINLILIENNSILDKFLRVTPGWQEQYRDEMAVIFTRGSISK
jgi:hypothetical protein